MVLHDFYMHLVELMKRGVDVALKHHPLSFVIWDTSMQAEAKHQLC